jgi:hypothetical protein
MPKFLWASLLAALLSRYNDGSLAQQVTLAPMDGIVLERVQNSSSARYQPSSENFPNPERGFYVQKAYRPQPGEPPPRALDEGELKRWRASGISLLRMYYVLSEFREAPLSAELLARIEQDFATVRKAGLKVIPRFAYNFGPPGEPDASLEWILYHLDQLKPLLSNNYDVIAFMEAGFIGAWGEWHSSTHDFFEPNPGGRPRLNEKSRAVIDKLFDAVPPARMIAFRYPQIKMELFGPEPLSETEAYTETPKARMAAHNDCFLASKSHRGTFTKNIEQEREFYRQDNLFVPQGGETCSDGEEAQPYIGCENALRELEELHFTTLNIGYHKGVLDLWRTQGCFGEIERRLGYRFRLLDSEATLSGDELLLSFRVSNDGFGNLYNRRPVYVVLRSVTGGDEFRFQVPKIPAGGCQGRTTQVSLSLRLPETLPAGDYEVLLWLPDSAETLRDRPEYAIRFANEGVWEEASGMNRLQHVISVTR